MLDLERFDVVMDEMIKIGKIQVSGKGLVAYNEKRTEPHDPEETEPSKLNAHPGRWGTLA